MSWYARLGMFFLILALLTMYILHLVTPRLIIWATFREAEGFPGSHAPNPALEIILFFDRLLLPIVAAVASVLGVVSTISAIYFGWRRDRRQAHEAQLKSQELELKIEQLKVQIEKPPDSETVEDK